MCCCSPSPNGSSLGGTHTAVLLEGPCFSLLVELQFFVANVLGSGQDEASYTCKSFDGESVIMQGGLSHKQTVNHYLSPQVARAGLDCKR